MVKVQVGDHNYYLDGYLKSNLDHVIKNVKKDFDAFILVVGREGYGKTTIASQMALYCDPTFNLDRMVFTAEQFIDAVQNAKKNEAIQFDETMGYLSARQNMSKFNRALIKVMSEMRSKNLFVFLCIPSFFIMDWYVSLHRSTGMIYTYKRARFGSYDYVKKKDLWVKGKKFHSYNVSPNFIGKFTKFFPFDKEAYEKKKAEAISQWTGNINIESIKQIQRDKLIRTCIENKYFTTKQIADLIGLSIRQIQHIVSFEKS